VTEYFEGTDLLSRVMEGAPFNERFVASIFYDIIISIAACHEQKICHRDLKLENVLINNENKIKIIDFGAANEVNPVEGLRGKSGTLFYLAPEIAAKNEFYDEKCDMWSIGVMIYCVMSKKFPFFGSENTVER